MKLRLVSVLGALALTAGAVAVPAAAASPISTASEPSVASVLPPAQTGASDPHQFGPTDYPFGPMTWGGSAWNNSFAPGWAGFGMSSMATQSAPSDSSSSGSSSGDSSSSWDSDGSSWHRHHHHMMFGGPTGSPWPWWAGMPIAQISAMTGGTWPWAFGPPLFLPPPVPPVPLVPLFGLGGFRSPGLGAINALGGVGSLTLAQAVALGLGRAGAVNNMIQFTPIGGATITLPIGQTLPGTTLGGLFTMNPGAFGGFGGLFGAGGLGGFGIIR